MAKEKSLTTEEVLRMLEMDAETTVCTYDSASSDEDLFCLADDTEDPDYSPPAAEKYGLPYFITVS